MAARQGARSSGGQQQVGLGAFMKKKGIVAKEKKDEGEVKLTEITRDQEEAEARKENREVLGRGSLLSQMNALTTVIQPGLRGPVKDARVQLPRFTTTGARSSGKSPSFKMERKLKEAARAPPPKRLSEAQKKIKKNGFRCGAAVTTAQGKQLKRDPTAGAVTDVKFWRDTTNAGPTGCWVEVTGFVREIAVQVSEICRLVDRFISDGKITLMHRNGDTIMLRDASPDELVHFTRWLRESKSASTNQTMKRKLEDDELAKKGAKRRASADQGRAIEDDEVGMEPRASFPPQGDGSTGLNGLPDEVINMILQLVPPEAKANSSPFGLLGLTCARLEHLVRTFTGTNQLRIVDGGEKPISNQFVLTSFRRRRGVRGVILADFTTLLPDTLSKMAQLPSAEYYRNITELCLRGCGKLNGKAVNMFIKRCRNLSHLDLFDVPLAAADATFVGLRRFCKNLKVIRAGALRRRFTCSITTDGISNITMPLRDTPSVLEELTLPRLNLDKVCQAGLDMITQRLGESLLRLDLSNPEGECLSLENLNALKHLQSLSIAGWQSSANSLSSALSGLGELQFLDLSETQITDEGLSSLSRTLVNLRRLKLSKCRAVNDDGVISVLESCEHLEMLDLAYNRKISEALPHRLARVASKERFKRLGIKETNLVPLFTAQLADCFLQHTGNTAVIFTIDLPAVEYIPPSRQPVACELSGALSLL